MYFGEKLDWRQTRWKWLVLAFATPLPVTILGLYLLKLVAERIPSVDQDPASYAAVPIYLPVVVGAYLFWRSNLPWRGALLVPYFAAMFVLTIILSLYLMGYFFDLWL